jgi:hypothetical protein
MLAHAIKRELDDLAALINAEGDDTLGGVVNLCTFAAGYIAIDVTGMRWPSQDMLRKIARNASQSATQLPITEDDTFEFLSRVALGNEMLDDVFSLEGAGLVPIYATANLLLTFFPKDKHWFEYLDQIWNAAEVADHISADVLPALMLRVRKQGRLSGSGTKHREEKKGPSPMPLTDQQVAPLRALLARQYEEYRRLFALLDQAAKNKGYRVLVSAAFMVAAERRFAGDVSQAEVIEFVADTRSRSPHFVDQVDPVIAERVLMSAITGESLDDVDPRTRWEAQGTLMAAMVADEHLDAAGLDAFLAEARKLADKLVA